MSMWERARELIPGGTQLLSKRSEIYPYSYEKAKGCYIWDKEGNRYIDMAHMGVGTCILGYANDFVNARVKGAVLSGSMSSLNCPEEIELAEVLIKLHPWAQMVRYARTGGEAMAIAVRIARAFTHKDKIVFSGYHGWSDWYLATNIDDKTKLNVHLLPEIEAKGVPKALKGTAIPFEYNKIEQLEKILESDQEIGVIVVETMRHEYPKDNFLQKVRNLANKYKCVLIFDEITIGWRLCVGGAHLRFNVNPDIAVFAKAISNGYPMAAIIGKKEVMMAANDTFISSTYWTERVGLVAALATIKKMYLNDVPNHLNRIGLQIAEGWKHVFAKHEIRSTILPPYPLITFQLDYPNAQELVKKFQIGMLERGYLAGTSVYVSLAHTSEIIIRYLIDFEKEMVKLAELLK